MAKKWDAKSAYDRTFLDAHAANLPQARLTVSVSDSHLMGAEYPTKTSTNASGKDYSKLPSFRNFPKGHILRKIAGYHANRVSHQLPAISDTDHPGSDIAPGKTAPISDVRATKSDRIAAVGVADFGSFSSPPPSQAPLLGNGIQRPLKMVREDKAAKKAKKQADNICKEALSTLEVIKSEVFVNEGHEIPDYLYRDLVQDLPIEVISYLPPGFIWWEMAPSMQIRAFWVAYARYYQKHPEDYIWGTVVELFAYKIGMTGWPPGFEDFAETLDMDRETNKSPRSQESGSSTPVSWEYDTDCDADTNTEWSQDELDDAERQYMVDTSQNDREDLDVSAIAEVHRHFQMGRIHDPFL